MDKLVVISRYNEDISWIFEYTNNFVIYNRGESLNNLFPKSKIVCVENIGGNQKDIFSFIVSNYTNFVWDTVAFVQGKPFDHCAKDILYSKLTNTGFTALEYYPDIKSGWEKRSEDGGYMEINNSWYIPVINDHYRIDCKYESFDQFMCKYFKNYIPIDWIRFAPGSQYMITKENVLHYSLEFWQALSDELQNKFCTEGHIIERALWLIFNGIYHARL